MAAPLRQHFLQRSVDNSHFRFTIQHKLKHIIPGSTINNGHNAYSSQVESMHEQQTVEETDATSKIRDISRLTPNQKCRLRGGLTQNQMKHAFMNKSILRKFYLKHKTTFNDIPPGVLWPSRSELNETLEYEEEFEPKLDEMLAQIKAEKQENEENLKIRLDTIEKNMQKMPQWIEEYKERIAQKEEEIRKQQEKRRKLIEEATEMFGYQIDPKDEKFQEMLERKEAEAKKLSKQKKKADRLLKEKLQLEALADETKTE